MISSGEGKLRAAVFLASGCLFSMEIVLAQIFGFVGLSEGVVKVLPIAFLGIGIGGLLAFLEPARVQIERSLMAASVATALSFLMVHFTLDRIWLMLAFTPPFACLGATIGIGLSLGRKPGIYVVDLLGGALGCLVTAVFFARIGAEALWALDGLLLAALAAFLRGRSRWKMPALMGLPCAVMLTAQLSAGAFDLVRFMEPGPYPGETTAKWAAFANQFAQHPGVEVVGSRWSLTSRVDVVASPVNPWSVYSNPDFRAGLRTAEQRNEHLRKIGLPGHRGHSLYYNNLLFSSMSPTTPESWHSFKAYLDWYDDPKLVIIGPAGGIEILIAAERGVSRISAVEINPATVQLLQDEFAAESGNAYDRARILTMDGRTFIHTADEKFDVIDLAGVFSWIAVLNSNVHIESYLHTVEAFEDYLDHLTDEGLIQMDVYAQPLNGERMRIVAAAASALRRMGLDPSERIIFLSTEMGHRIFGTNPGVLYVGLAPIAAAWIDRVAAISDLDPARRIEYAPSGTGSRARWANDRVLEQLVKPEEPELMYSLAESQGLEIRPPTDDRPFFYDFEVKRTELLRVVRWTVVSVVMMAVLIVIAVMLDRRRRGLVSYRFRSPLVWACGLSGGSYGLVQIALIQRFNVFVGSPIGSFIAVALGIVGGGALGAWLARRWSADGCGLSYAGAAVLLLILGTPVLIEPNSIVLSSMNLRLAVVFAVTLPLGFLISAPFPQILAGLETHQAGSAVLGYGLNGIFLVIATSLGLAVSAFLGFSALATIGAATYVLNIPLLQRGLRS